MGNFRRVLCGYLGILRSIFSSDTQIFTPNPVYVSLFHELMAVMLFVYQMTLVLLNRVLRSNFRRLKLYLLAQLSFTNEEKNVLKTRSLPL